MNLSIAPISNDDLQPTIKMLQHNREVLFPLLPSKSEAEVREEFEKDFIHAPLGLFLLAKDRKKNIVATIGMRTYDNRFKQFGFPGQTVVEVVKLFVHPAFRRFGVGSLMFKTLELEARSVGGENTDNRISQLYLHTHKFLSGALPFWTNQGFSILCDQGGELQTVHLRKDLSTNDTLVKTKHELA